jgi:hypothetical protein
MSKILAETITNGRVDSVTFVNVNGAVQTLTFHKKGVDVAGEAEDSPRIVGEDVPVFNFKTAREAVTAAQNGELE